MRSDNDDKEVIVTLAQGKCKYLLDWRITFSFASQIPSILNIYIYCISISFYLADQSGSAFDRHYRHVTLLALQEDEACDFLL